MDEESMREIVDKFSSAVSIVMRDKMDKESMREIADKFDSAVSIVMNAETIALWECIIKLQIAIETLARECDKEDRISKYINEVQEIVSQWMP